MKIEKVETGYLNENCYVISIDNDCLIIDPGDDFDKIRELVKDKNVLGVLITHYHFDHIGALEDVKNYYQVEVVDYKNDKNMKIGPFTFVIIPTPGHKEDSVTYYFKEFESMFVGDFIFKGTIGRCDLEGGDFEMMKESLNNIKCYDENIKIYPGHGDFSTLKNELKENPYMRGEFYA